MGSHISLTRMDDMKITRDYCPDCKKRSYFFNFYQEWYGWHSTCLRCGRQYADGEWIHLEFSRFARKQNIESARRCWRERQDEIKPQYRQ